MLRGRTKLNETGPVSMSERKYQATCVLAYPRIPPLETVVQTDVNREDGAFIKNPGQINSRKWAFLLHLFNPTMSFPKSS